MEEKFLELLELAKQNGSQATTVLLEIEQLLNGENEQIQELLESAKQNGTQAITVLLQIEQILCGDDEQYQELLEKAKQNGSQATTVITELVETKGVEPQPIPVEGDVQIFANPECTEYATGEVFKVYARINKPWNFGDSWSVGTKISATSPNREFPDDDFGLTFYTDFTNFNGHEPYEVGEVVELSLNLMPAIDVTNFDKIFSNPALPVEGDVQIFANPECTEYATGVVNKVYARVNKPWGKNEEWIVDNKFLAAAPSTEYPDDPYHMIYYADFMSGDSDVPFEVGEVVKLPSSTSIDVTNIDKVFSKPQ